MPTVSIRQQAENTFTSLNKKKNEEIFNLRSIDQVASVFKTASKKADGLYLKEERGHRTRRGMAMLQYTSLNLNLTLPLPLLPLLPMS